MTALPSTPMLPPPPPLASTTPPALLIDIQAAALCGMSRSGWRKMDAAGRIPRAIKISRCCRWRADELHAWIAAGCPARVKWQSIYGNKFNK